MTNYVERNSERKEKCKEMIDGEEKNRSCERKVMHDDVEKGGTEREGERENPFMNQHT